ncbi:MAG: HAMP domain-containing histidine kinase, partial [Magnetococcales bacterium]|nr:HAMP domain-containing histidine kinase [Magnetococcales bacterium]
GPIRHDRWPSWMPAKADIRGLIHVTLVLLCDPRGRVVEIYQGNQGNLPEALRKTLEGGADGNPSLKGGVRTIGEANYLVSRGYVGGTASASALGSLVLVTPLDSRFLLSLQMQADGEGIMVFLSPDGQTVIASDRNDRVDVGAKISDLGKYYLMDKRILHDEDAPAVPRLQVATLISRSRFGDMSQAVYQVDHLWQMASFSVLLLVFFAIIHWLARRIQAFIKEIQETSRQISGAEPALASGGDQLQVMAEQFRLLMSAMAEIRSHLEERERQLTMANKSLWESLVMVKRTQSKLFEAEKMAYLGGLVAGVAHEINTPLGIGITAASFLDDKCRELQKVMDSKGLKKSDLVAFVSDVRESSAMVVNNLQRAAELIRSFKQVAVDQSSAERRRFNVCEYIQQIFNSLQPRLRKTRITVTTECPDLLEYDGFPGVLSQILTNLVENSLKHGFEADDAGTIHLQVLKMDGHIRMLYGDSGRGIAPDVLSQVFDPFFTTARNKGGSGLGLHIVYNLVTQTLGGSIHCESSLGSGVLFTVVFPEIMSHSSDGLRWQGEGHGG